MSSSASLRALVTAAAAAAGAIAAIPISPKQKLFGHAIKNGPLQAFPYEQETFNHTCTSPPCVVTSINVPSIYPQGSDAFAWEQGRVRVYVDGSATPSVDVTLLELAHVGARGASSNNPPKDGSPFGNDLFGKTAITGGVYTTMRIPFASTIRTTITAPPSSKSSSVFWFVIRGIEALPVTLGGELTLPDQARLSVVRTNVAGADPNGALITIAAAPAGTAGALATVYIDANSTDYAFLEACLRFTADGGATQFVSSGTEDFFYSASYFDEGQFQVAQAGVSYKDGNSAVSMWKRLDSRDFMPWAQSMQLQWRNNEDGACPNTWPWPGSPAAAASAAATSNRAHSKLTGSAGLGNGQLTATVLVWMYTWPAQQSLLTFSGVPAV